MWDQLPELILTEIFSHLGNKDRATSGQVCRVWEQALSSPILWRSVTVLVDRDLRGEFPLAKKLAVLIPKLCGRLALTSPKQSPFLFFFHF